MAFIEVDDDDIDPDLDEDNDVSVDDDGDPFDYSLPDFPHSLLRSTAMHISLQPSEPGPRNAIAKSWLTRILAQPSLAGIEFPRELKGYVYIDNVPQHLSRGSWNISDGCIYLASASSNVDPLTRLAVLTTVGNMYDAVTDPAIMEAIQNRLVSAISDSVRSIYHGFIRGTQSPSRLAIDQTNARVAAEMNGSWFLTSGAPVTVDNSWIVMDF